MPDSADFQKNEKSEHPSTYVVQDRKSQAELSRLMVQDQMITVAMGGVFPEQPPTTTFSTVLDVGSGSGSWILEAALRYPDSTFVGVDISQRMVDYARERTRELNLSERVEFHSMDALRMLEFPDNTFDLVNLRFGASFLRTWDWPKLLSEFLRVANPGGTIRITETEIPHQSSSVALRRFHELLLRAFYRGGYFFEDERQGMVSHLAPLLTRHGCEQVQTRPYALEYRTGEPSGEAYYGDAVHGFQTLRPLLQKWGCLPEDYDSICQQALNDLKQEGFVVTWNLLTAWGIKPEAFH